MKKYLLITALMVFPGISALAQNDEEEVFERREIIIVDEEDEYGGQTREVIVYEEQKKNRKIPKFNGKHRVSFGGIGLGYNGLVSNLGNLKLPTDGEDFSLKAKSINFNVLVVTYERKITDHFYLGTGFELEVNNFRFDTNVALSVDPLTGESYMSHEYSERGIDLQKSKLVTAYLNVPIVAKVNIGPAQKFGIYGGIVGGWRWIAYTKLKANHPEFSGKHRYHNDYNLRNLHWGYTAGLNFKHYGVYATYYPKSIFRSGKGPDLKQVNIGIKIFY